MVDPDRLRAILQRTSADVAALDRYARDRQEVRADVAKLGHTKYLFVTAAEGVVNAAQHVCASDDLGVPASNADAVRLLMQAGFVEPDVAERMMALVGFRNLLVHAYARIDDDRVVEHLADVDAIRRYIQALTALL